MLFSSLVIITFFFKEKTFKLHTSPRGRNEQEPTNHTHTHTHTHTHIYIYIYMYVYIYIKLGFSLKLQQSLPMLGFLPTHNGTIIGLHNSFSRHQGNID